MGVWKQFELEYGNEDTIREMFRLKRSVQALFTSDVNFHKAQLLLAQQQKKMEEQEQEQLSNIDKMALLDQTKEGRTKGATSQELIEQYKQKQFVKSGESKNPDEIDLNDDDEEDESGGQATIATKMIPTQVFGSLKANDEE